MRQPKNKVSPPGRIKIVRALKQLLVQKDFNSITTAEIAKTAGVTEGLIYKYFNDKRDLLYKVLLELFEMFLQKMKKDINLKLKLKRKETNDEERCCKTN